LPSISSIGPFPNKKVFDLRDTERARDEERDRDNFGTT
jgi:hypothetical protein